MQDGGRAERAMSDYLVVLLKWRHVIVANVLVVTAITIVLALVVPQWYVSAASVIPTEQAGMEAGLLSYVQASLPLFQLPGVSSPSQVLLSVLESRRVKEVVVRENDLERVYRSRNIDQAILALKDRVSLAIDENGSVIIAAEARDPVLARDIAVTFLDELERYNSEVRTTNGRRVREFVEGRLEETRQRLADAEERLVSFQSEHATIEVTEQARAVIGTMAELEALVATTEIQLGLLRGYASADHPEVVKLESQLREYRIRMAALKSSEDGEQDGMLVSLSDLPELAVELAGLMRETEVLNQVYTYLVQEYESARIQEARDTPTLQILDYPGVPEMRARPRRTVMVVIGALIGLLAGILAAFVLEFYGTTDGSNPTRRNLDAAAAMLRDDLRRLTRGRRPAA
jgi:tyrosine-protein kinase Etk/Wzc